MEGDFRDAVDLPVGGDRSPDPVGGRPSAWVVLGEVDPPLLVKARGGEMILECGPFQWFMPVWRGWSVRTHSRIEETRGFSTSRGVTAGDAFMTLPFSSWTSGCHGARNLTATGANRSWYWKMPPCPESG
ncbi:hypothetical protein GCM10010372_51570 [Streptomyces tauricus]|nr:hypothetical protein GCM10010372_51570 [Streptomyces tauricus]